MNILFLQLQPFFRQYLEFVIIILSIFDLNLLLVWFLIGNMILLFILLPVFLVLFKFRSSQLFISIKLFDIRRYYFGRFWNVFISASKWYFGLVEMLFFPKSSSFVMFILRRQKIFSFHYFIKRFAVRLVKVIFPSLSLLEPWNSLNCVYLDFSVFKFFLFFFCLSLLR